MEQSILILEEDSQVIQQIQSLKSVFGQKIHIESSFESAEDYFSKNNCYFALQEVILNGKTSTGLIDSSKDPKHKNYFCPIAVMSALFQPEPSSRIKLKTFGAIKKPFSDDQLKKTLEALFLGALTAKMDRILKQMKFTEQIMVIDGLTEVIVKLSTIVAGFLREAKPFDSKAANSAMNEFMMIVGMEDGLKPEVQILVNGLDSNVRALYAILEAKTTSPLPNMMVSDIFTFYTNDEIVIPGIEPTTASESQTESDGELTPEQIDDLMGGGASEPDPEPNGDLTPEQIDALMNNSGS